METSNPLVCTLVRPSELGMARFDLAVVIDVFRATSTATSLLERGFSEILSVPSVRELRVLAETRRLLAISELVEAEECAQRIDNSPVKVRSIEPKGETPVMVTTNGTRVLSLATRCAGRVILGSFMNLTAVVSMVAKSGAKTVAVVPCGDVERVVPHTEDDACATALMGIFRGERIDIPSLLSACRSDPRVHRRRDRDASFEADLDVCLTPDSCSAVAEYKDRGSHGWLGPTTS